MESQKSNPELKQTADAPASPATTSCRVKKKDEAAFLEDLKDHIDEFVHASMDEHKECFKKTVKKMFGLSKIVAEKEKEKKSEQQEVESILPLQTTVSN